MREDFQNGREHAVKIAFLGLGRMGRELVAHLLADEEVTVWNRSPAAAGPFGQRGARVAPDPQQAAADADVVMTVLFGAEAVREVVCTEPTPLREGVLWIDVTSVSPADTEQFAAWAGAHGVRYVHSPVVGSLAPARAGQLGVLLGGATADLDVAEPVVAHWAAPDRLRRYDSAGKAATAKLIANLALAVSMQGLLEALRLGHGGGLSSTQVLEALDHTMLSGITEMKGRLVLDGDFDDTQFSAALLRKDTRLMLDTSSAPLPALTAVFESLEDAVRAGAGEQDFAVIAAADR
jgi:3-hydroxyisobutyrate dehydrogenase